MKPNNIKNIILISITLFLVLLTQNDAFAQRMTRVSGKVIDAQTKEPLPFVNIIFVGKSIGTTTDFKGYYSIETQWASNKLKASFIGYNDQIKDVITEKGNVINFELESKSFQLNQVVITAKKKRYRNKENPAVALIRKIVANKKNNRKEKLDYYEYDKYEKVEFDLNNITEDFRKKRVFKKLQFIFDYVDTSAINGKPYLPMFLEETKSKVYYRKSPNTQKEHVSGVKITGFHEYIDNDGISFFVDNIFQGVNIYDNNIPLLTNQFASPISDAAPSIYKFFIIDTVDVNGYDCIHLAFQPRNKADFAFKGNLFVTNDDQYAVIKVEMRVMDEINLNFVKDLLIVQEFDFFNNESWMLTKDEIVVDFNLLRKGTGMFGRKNTSYKDYVFNKKRDNKLYSGLEAVIKKDGWNKRDENFWTETRHSELTENEKGVYKMVDSVQHVPAFKRTMDIIALLVSGYWSFGPIDVGPVNTFYSFNDVEGLRLRIGGQTNKKFNERLKLEGYLLYGFKDERVKYSGAATFSLNKKSLAERPKHTLRAMYQVETNFPGMEMQFVNEDNFLLSFKRGVSDKIIYYKATELEHFKEWGNGISSTFKVKQTEQKPGGSLAFNFDDYSLEKINSSEISAILRFAPNEKFYQGMDYKTPMITKYPIFQLSYTQGVKGLFNADYTYSKFTFDVFKRFYLSRLGYTDVKFEAGKIIGKAPFPLLFVHRANQTFSYQLYSYNMMNFLEFVSDEFVSLSVDHQFNGLIFNRIPLFKRLKLREVISFKGIFGKITDENNPLETAGLMNFPTDIDGNTTTFTLENEPYIEMSVGVANIFKFFRVDLVRRITYLDNPNVSKYGIRARFKFVF